MNPRDIQPKIDAPLNRLFFAINHYISTGEHFGVGIAEDADGGTVRIMIPVNLSLEEDRRNWECFRSRFEELREAYQLHLDWMGAREPFEAWAFRVREDQMDDLARELRAKPGTLGWGSGKTIIDQYRWEGE